MNIDLLLTAEGEAGLITSGNFVTKAACAVFDTQSGALTVEFIDMDYMELNIPVEENFFDALDLCPQIHIGAIQDGNIAQAYQVPFMFLDDPYRGEAMKQIPGKSNPLAAFDKFVKSCVAGQPVHRDDLGDESAMGCILGDAVPSSLQFAPHLARRHAMELGPKPGLQINAPGLGLGSSGSASRTTVIRKSRKPDNNED